MENMEQQVQTSNTEATSNTGSSARERLASRLSSLTENSDVNISVSESVLQPGKASSGC